MTKIGYKKNKTMSPTGRLATGCSILDKVLLSFIFIRMVPYAEWLATQAQKQASSLPDSDSPTTSRSILPDSPTTSANVVSLPRQGPPQDVVSLPRQGPSEGPVHPG